MQNDAVLYDLAFLHKFTKGDRAKIERYIQTYLRTSERIFNELEDAGKKGSWDDAYTKAHTVKPQVEYMGINSLLDIIREIENKSQLDPDGASLSDLVEAAVDIHKRSAAELLTYLQDAREGDV